nr:ABC transporter ATP-binding protein [uncultured Oscillibacter sp.]
MESRNKLSIKDLTHYFIADGKRVCAIDDVSLDVKENEFLVLLGPGQCGKTVLLNLIAGLLKPTVGEIFIDGESIQGTDKRIAMVFQQHSVFPWKTVMGNVEIGPKYAGVPKGERQERAQHFIELVGLKGFEEHFPRQLSGGMKQRVGIARAYTANPEILLMDEPFGALDAQTRYSMEDEILRIWEQDKRTVIFVTNNIEEAVALGDRIVLFSKAPAHIKEIYDLRDFKKPRDNVSRRFLEVRDMISSNTDMALE